MKLTYTQCRDYLIPDLVLSDTSEYHIGKYGRMRRAYLKDHRPALYSTLLLTEKLFPHLAEIDAAYKNRLDIIETAGRRNRGPESRRSDGVGASDEQHPQPGRRNHPTRTCVHRIISNALTASLISLP